MDKFDFLRKEDLQRVIRISYLVAVLMAIASLVGLFFSELVYPSDGLRQAFVSNDLVNLVLGLPVLLLASVLARRGKLLGLLLWPGVLLFVSYNAIAYVVALAFSWLSFLYIGLIVLSGYGVFRLLASLDRQAIKQRLTGKTAERLAAVILVVFGLLFFGMRAGIVWQGLVGGREMNVEIAVAIADLITTPLWIIGGILLWRRYPLGYAGGLGLLFQGSLLFIGLLFFFLFQPFLAEVAFPLEDFVVILIMGLIFFLPFGLFVRGVLSDSSTVSPPL